MKKNKKYVIIGAIEERKVKAMVGAALCTVPAGYIVDGAILLGMLIFLLICRKRGFVKMLFHFASGILALIAAISLAKTVCSATGGLFGLQGSLQDKFVGMFSKMSGFDVDISGQDVGALISEGNISTIIATLIAKKYAGVELAAGTTLGYLAGSTVAELLCTLLTGIAMFFILKIFFKLLAKIFTLIIKKIKILDRVNRFLGVVFGFVEAVVVISIVMSILTLIPSTAMYNFFNSSIILRLLYNHNPIVWLLGFLL